MVPSRELCQQTARFARAVVRHLPKRLRIDVLCMTEDEEADCLTARILVTTPDLVTKHWPEIAQVACVVQGSLRAREGRNEGTGAHDPPPPPRTARQRAGPAGTRWKRRAVPRAEGWA